MGSKEPVRRAAAVVSVLIALGTLAEVLSHDDKLVTAVVGVIAAIGVFLGSNIPRSQVSPTETVREKLGPGAVEILEGKVQP